LSINFENEPGILGKKIFLKKRFFCYTLPAFLGKSKTFLVIRACIQLSVGVEGAIEHMKTGDFTG
jgi:hypothetical protein